MVQMVQESSHDRVASSFVDDDFILGTALYLQVQKTSYLRGSQYIILRICKGGKFLQVVSVGNFKFICLLKYLERFLPCWLSDLNVLENNHVPSFHNVVFQQVSVGKLIFWFFL